MKKTGNKSYSQEEEESQKSDKDDGVVLVDNLDFFFLDSSNMKHLDLPDKECPEFFNKRVRDKLDGIKPTDKRAIKQAIQSIFDIRRSLIILQDIF